ncbi:Signaling mucin like [Actinidia chinensis var. chinensis]|uniref:Signaling mucin like n=1 Tax=Actinidia chinensis var. chinensis TaxID=1590841 RepID=A0A2R6QAP0_ACTCC|nr:Signaling mucin like [Actinidia chinensis var. chinensis]
MEDSSGMTIEFLRVRLLSERSVSRTARQRADELAKKVVELEEQLKSVSLQRNKAEQATVDVLSILENHGITEFPEQFDSSSDQEETCCESKVGNGFLKEDESSVDSKMRRNHMDEFSGSELESSPLPGRSLSWKSGKNSPHSHEKKNVDSSTRRRSTFASATSASLKLRVGKSCRQIQRRDTRSAGEETQVNSNIIPREDNGVDTCSEGSHTLSDTGREILRGRSERQDAKILVNGPVSGDFENQGPERNSSHYSNVHRSEKDMERALKHQAQLIGRYEEEEKAQREWEEKFKEDNNSTPASSEPGNRSDVTEERDETTAHASPNPVATIASQDQDRNLKVEDVCITKESPKRQSDGLQSSPHVDLGRLQDQKSSGMLASVFPMATGKQDPQHSRNFNVLPCNHHRSCSERHAENQSAPVIPSHEGTNLRKGVTFGSKNEQYAKVTCEKPDKLGSVLEALHQAKLSLKDKLDTLPTIDGSGSIVKAIEYSVGDKPEVPVGCTGLFRVPSDFYVEATNKSNVLGSNSQLSLTNYYRDVASALTAGDRFITSPYTGTRSSASTSDRHLTIPMSLHTESSSKQPIWESPACPSRFSSPVPLVEPSLDMGLPYSSRSTYSDPNRDTVLPSSIAYTPTTYPVPLDLMPQMPFNERLQLFSHERLRPLSSGGAAVHQANHLSFHNDHVRPNMY